MCARTREHVPVAQEKRGGALGPQKISSMEEQGARDLVLGHYAADLALCYDTMLRVQHEHQWRQALPTRKRMLSPDGSDTALQVPAAALAPALVLSLAHGPPCDCPSAG